MELPVAGMTRAGEPEAELPEGSAWLVMTGAPVPRGADAVVMQEFVEEHGARVTVQRMPMRGQNIVLRGAEAQTGGIQLNPGVRLGAVEIGLAASSGYAQMKVLVTGQAAARAGRMKKAAGARRRRKREPVVRVGARKR